MAVARFHLVACALAVAGAAASGQSVVLQIKPRLGDTLHMRLDQETEMTGSRRDASAGTEAAIAALSMMTMYSRAIVERKAGAGTTVLAITDSVHFTSADEQLRRDAERLEQQLRGKRLRFLVAGDGTVTMAEDDAKTLKEVSDVVSLMPAAFPKSAVSVGESWIREMPLAAGTLGGAPMSGKLHVTFRLDSLVRGGALAYLSMRGEMQPGTPLPGMPAVEKGTVTGTMLVDRQRGWLTDSRFSILVTSAMTPPSVTGIAAMRMRVRITQHMQTVDKR